jgi:uncharacterized protein (TIGR02594 family)
MPTTSQIVVANTSGFFSKTASLLDVGEIEFFKGDRLSVEATTIVAGQTWLEVTRFAQPDQRGFIRERDTDHLLSEAVDTSAAMEPIPLVSFARAILESSRGTGSNPGVLLAIAFAESGASWKKKSDSWTDAVIEPGAPQEHGGIGPFQFRPGMWAALVQAFPDSLQVSDRFSAIGQAHAAALMEKRFAQGIGGEYTTLDLYLDFILGSTAAKAIREATANASLSELLSKAFVGDQTALQNELKWRSALLMDGEKVRSLEGLKSAAVALLNKALEVAEAVLVAIGARRGGDETRTPKDAGGAASQSHGNTMSAGNPSTRVPRELVVLARSPNGYQTPKGYLVRILQAALSHGHYYNNTIDGEYGPSTEAAVRLFQDSRKMKADGQCHAADWEQITGLQAPSLFDRCLQLSASYEGTGFTKVLGNWDDAVMTWGIIGYTLDDDTDLSAMIREIDEQIPGALDEAFGPNRAVELRRIMARGVSRADRVAWVSSITAAGQKRNLEAAWDDGFEKLGNMPGVQKIQILRAQTKYWSARQRTIPCALQFHANDELDVAMLFDISVQNGGIATSERVEGFTRIAVEEPALRNGKRREKWANIVASASKPMYQEDVRTRKISFARGEGVIHGDRYRLEDWGLGPNPISEIQLKVLKDEVDIAFMPSSFGIIKERDGDANAIAGNLSWLQTAMSLEGTREDLTAASNPTIMSWAQEIGATIKGFFYKDDSVPWCGLFVAHCMVSNDIEVRKDVLWALDWAKFGKELQEPTYGCVMVFTRKDGGHVGFYISEDDGTYHILGGNQSDQVNITKMEKGQFVAARWPESQMRLWVQDRRKRTFAGKIATSRDLA